MFIPDPGFFPITDTGTNNNKKRGGGISFLTFVAIYFF